MITPLLRRLLLLVVLGGAVAAPTLGQNEPIKFGKPDPKDFDPQSFVADSAAEAVVLCDFGRSRFEVGAADEGFRTVFERTTRIKILSKAGYDWATVEVPLYHTGSQEEKFTNLRGFTYNLVNGAVVKEKLETAAFREETSPNVTTRKFTLPNVREGAVIEYSYTVVSDFLFNFQDWQFQHSIPVRWSEYRAQVPEYFDYKMLMQGYVPLAVSEHPQSSSQYTVRWNASIEPGLNGGRTAGGSETVSAQVTNHRWAVQNAPAFRDEPFMTSARDYVARIDFELAGVRWPNQAYRPMTSSWQSISDELLADESFGMQLKRGGFLKDQLTPLLAKSGSDAAARVAAVHELVRKAVKYDGNNRLYSQSSIRKAYDQHRGNAADVNLLLIAALREAGFAANPVLLSTRDHGFVNSDYMPMLSRFNYVVAHVALPEGKEMLLDATEELVPCGMLPARCLNGQGRLLMPKVEESRWVSLVPQQRLTEYQQVQLVLDDKGGYTGKVHSEHGGYAALAQRSRLREQGEKKFVENMLRGREGWNVSKYEFRQRDALDQPLALDYEVSVAGADAPASLLYLRPLQAFGNSKNPFLHEDRLFPVDFGCALDETLMLTLTLPAGYAVEELPKPTSVALPDNGGRFMFQAQPAPNGTVQITSRLNLTRPVYSAEEYASLREFYRLVVAKQAEQVVLKKKS